MNQGNGRILIVANLSDLRPELLSSLDAARFDVGTGDGIEEAMLRLRLLDYDVALLYTGHPGEHGTLIVHELRCKFPRLTIIVISARDDDDDKVDKLESGADDYVTKKASNRELIARIRAGVRRSRVSPPLQVEPISIGSVTLDPERRRVERSGKEVRLTAIEYEMLQLLMENAGRPVAYARLLGIARGPGHDSNREYLRVFISQIRKKLGDDPAKPRYILTEHFFGYRFREAGKVQ